MIRKILKKAVPISLVLFFAMLGWTTLGVPAVAAADNTNTAVNPAQQQVLDSQICPALKKIKGEKLSKLCTKYSSQSDMDKAVKQICDKYGGKELKNECKAYDQAATAVTCTQGDALCSTCGQNPNASGCPCANDSQACTDNATTCSSGNCDLIKKYINPTIDAASVAFGLIAAGSLILGGINFASSEGDPQKSARARDRISKTLIAVVAYFFLYSFLEFLIPGGVFNR